MRHGLRVVLSAVFVAMLLAVPTSSQAGPIQDAFRAMARGDTSAAASILNDLRSGPKKHASLALLAQGRAPYLAKRYKAAGNAYSAAKKRFLRYIPYRTCTLRHTTSLKFFGTEYVPLSTSYNISRKFSSPNCDILIFTASGK